MSVSVTLATARRQVRALQHAQWLEGGTLSLYSGAKPAGPEMAPGGVLLCQFVIPVGATNVVDAVITLIASLVNAAVVLVSGTPTFARARDAQSVVISDLDVGGVGSGHAIQLDETNLVAGGHVNLVDGKITEG